MKDSFNWFILIKTRFDAVHIKNVYSEKYWKASRLHVFIVKDTGCSPFLRDGMIYEILFSTISSTIFSTIFENIKKYCISTFLDNYLPRSYFYTLHPSFISKNNLHSPLQKLLEISAFYNVYTSFHSAWGMKYFKSILTF